MTVFDNLKKMPLADFCVKNLGYEVNKNRDSKTWRSIKSKKGISIITKDVPNENGHYVWSSPENNEGGTIIDLFLNVENMTFKEIFDTFGQKLPTPLPLKKETLKPKKEDFKNILKKALDKVPKVPPNDNYLTKRSINNTTIDVFGVKPNTYNWFVPLYIFDEKKQRTRLQTAISYQIFYDKRQRFFLPIPKEGAISILSPSKFKNLKDFFLFESPIDALSYFQLTKKNGVYISFCGNIGKKGLRNLQFLLEKIAPKTVYNVEVCFDNDDAGDKMFEEIKSYFSLKLVKRNFPSGKDFNDDLVNLSG